MDPPMQDQLREKTDEEYYSDEEIPLETALEELALHYETEIKAMQDKIKVSEDKRAAEETRNQILLREGFQKILVLEAKKRRFEAEIAKLNQEPLEFAELLEANPDFVKNTFHAELDLNLRSLEEAMVEIQKEMKYETTLLESDTLLLSELKAIGGAIGDEIQKIEAGEGNLSSDRPTKYQMMKRRVAKVEQANGALQGEISKFVRHHLSHFTKTARPKRGRGEDQSQLSQTATIRDIRVILEVLMNSLVVPGADPFHDYIQENWDVDAIDFLLDAQAIEVDPTNTQRIRLLPFDI